MASQQQQMTSFVAAQTEALRQQQTLINNYSDKQQQHLTAHADNLNTMMNSHNQLTQVHGQYTVTFDILYLFILLAFTLVLI